MMDVTVANFEEEVIAASMTTPVLIDFWAPWCGPCKVIGPLLEKIETDYAGRFKLIKIDSDQELSRIRTRELAGVVKEGDLARISIPLDLVARAWSQRS